MRYFCRKIVNGKLAKLIQCHALYSYCYILTYKPNMPNPSPFAGSEISL